MYKFEFRMGGIGRKKDFYSRELLSIIYFMVGQVLLAVNKQFIKGYLRYLKNIQI